MRANRVKGNLSKTTNVFTVAITACFGLCDTIHAQSTNIHADDYSALQHSTETEDISNLATADRELFSPKSWTFNIYGSAGVGSDDGEAYLSHAGIGYFFLDGHSINAEVTFGHLDADSGAGDSTAVGIDLLLRWHFLRNKNWSAYIDAGAGLIWTNNVFPAGGTHQNFTPQAGAGVTVKLDDRTHLMVGARWYHISNADKVGANRNPGYNAAMAYAGLMFAY